MNVGNIQDLSDYVLIDIFKNLCERDIPQIREVCSRWAHLVSNYTDLRRKYSLFVSHCILNDDNEFVQTFLISPFTIPTTLTFHYVVFQNSNLLLKLWKKIGKSIESLHIILGNLNFPIINRATYGHNWNLLLKETNKLTELGLKLDTWTSQTIEPISLNENYQLGKLEKITLSCFNPSLNIFLMKMLLKFAKRLESIDYTGNKGSTMEADNLCRLIVSREFNLRILRLGDFKCEARVVIKIIQKLVYLEEMEIKVNAKDPAFDEDTFKNISNMGNLMSLSILDYCQLCDDTFLTHHLHVPTLKKLWLDTDNGKNTKITNYGVSALYRNCPLLDQLVLINFDAITNTVLDQMPVLLLHLSEVVIRGKYITNKKLTEIRKCLENRL